MAPVPPREVVEAALVSAEIPFARAGDGVWMAQLRGENKLTIPLVLALRDRGLRLQSFFIRRPVENAEGVYRLLLSRNMRTPGVWFAVDDAGDVHLVAELPTLALDADALDRMLGTVLVTADETFNAAIQAGFATYFARDMAWRAKQAAP